MPSDWTRIEVEALVSDYLDMLTSELRGEQYSKTAHRRALAPVLQQRTDGSIERKRQNVSAILIELGYPYISGYKPLGNYQALLADVVVDQVAENRTLNATVHANAEAPAPIPSVDDFLSRWERPPEPIAVPSYKELRERRRTVQPSRAPVNYLELEARNTSLGRAGESFVLNYERARLIKAGRERLANDIEHIAITRGDGAGFDVRSFEIDGRDRLIEVKTTAYGKQTPFFLSRNELAVSQEFSDSFHLYRLFSFRSDPRLYGLNGALDQVCHLDPAVYSARVKVQPTPPS